MYHNCNGFWSAFGLLGLGSPGVLVKVVASIALFLSDILKLIPIFLKVLSLFAFVNLYSLLETKEGKIPHQAIGVHSVFDAVAAHLNRLAARELKSPADVTTNETHY